MTLRLRGKWTGESDSLGNHTIMLPPLSRSPEVGDEVLIALKVHQVGKDYVIAGNLQYSMEHIVAILDPTGEKECECHYGKNIRDPNTFGGFYSKDCPIHGNKAEEKMVKIYEGFLLQDGVLDMPNVFYARNWMPELVKITIERIGAKRPDAKEKVGLPLRKLSELKPPDGFYAYCQDCKTGFIDDIHMGQNIMCPICKDGRIIMRGLTKESYLRSKEGER